jgi:hypothetical protein
MNNVTDKLDSKVSIFLMWKILFMYIEVLKNIEMIVLFSHKIKYLIDKIKIYYYSRGSEFIRRPCPCRTVP